MDDRFFFDKMTIEIHATIKATAYIEPFGKAFMRMCKRSESKRTITEDEELEEAFQEVLSLFAIH